jgi:hypothetical protein
MAVHSVAWRAGRFDPLASISSAAAPSAAMGTRMVVSAGAT